MYTTGCLTFGEGSYYARSAEVTHQEWIKEVEEAIEQINDGRPLKRASSWLFREAYYDGYDVGEAVALALDRDTEFKMIRVGWMGPK
jgi:hypothetical protein